MGSIIVGLSLPHVVNVRFKAMIPCGPLAALADQGPICFSKAPIQRDVAGTVGIRQITTYCCRMRLAATGQMDLSQVAH